MTEHIKDNSIDLSNIELRNFSEAEKASFKKINDGFEKHAEVVLQAMVKDSNLLRMPNVDFSQILQFLNEANELEVIEEWLSEKLSRVRETKRHKLSEVKTVIEQMVKQARPISESDTEVANTFADLFDFLSAPAKKAAATRKKNSSTEDNSSSSSAEG